jgi:hypothetical protein
MDIMIDTHQTGGVLDYNACSDYDIGKVLGIPQEKIRTLKVKKQARYPRIFDWRKSLAAIQDNIVYDSEKKKVIIPVRDPNLYNEIRNFIEEKGGYIEIQRGGNYIMIRPEYLFILLYNASGTDDEKKKIREEFAKQLRERNEKEDIDNIRTDAELHARVWEIGDDFLEFAKSVAGGLSNPVVGIISGIQSLVKIARR